MPKKITFSATERNAVMCALAAIKKGHVIGEENTKPLTSLLNKMNAALLPSPAGISPQEVFQIAREELGRVGMANPAAVSARVTRLGLDRESLRKVFRHARSAFRPPYGIMFVLSRAEALLADDGEEVDVPVAGGPNDLEV